MATSLILVRCEDCETEFTAITDGCDIIHGSENEGDTHLRAEHDISIVGYV